MASSGTVPRIVIIGAGPTGLGAAYRLHELGITNFTVIDKAEGPGGLSATYSDEKGFLWDLGGHVLFSHYSYFDEAVDKALGDKWLHHQRVSYVWIRNRFVAYPFQNNIAKLPKEDVVKCIMGLIDCQKATYTAPPANFEEWIERSMGRGISDLFMLPYNFKVWAYPPREMSVQWMGERVAVVNLQRVIENVVHDREDAGWGPNATFRFPLNGGTGGIWTGVADLVPKERFRYNSTMSSIDATNKVITLESGEKVEYDYLINTSPLDLLLKSIPSHPQLAELGEGLVYSSSHIVGIGIKGERPAHIDTKCWLYFPEDDSPFYRATVFSNYSPNNVPSDVGPCWSLMFEVSESPVKPVDIEKVIQDCIQGAINSKLISEDDVVISTWHKRLHHGYPTPSLHRDAALAKAQPVLLDLGIYSRGRFGGWKYEVGNQDHSFLQGAEAVNNILFGYPEKTYFDPSYVNNPANKEANCVNFQRKTL